MVWWNYLPVLPTNGACHHETRILFRSWPKRCRRGVAGYCQRSRERDRQQFKDDPYFFNPEIQFSIMLIGWRSCSMRVLIKKRLPSGDTSNCV